MICKETFIKLFRLEYIRAIWMDKNKRNIWQIEAWYFGMNQKEKTMFGT